MWKGVCGVIRMVGNFDIITYMGKIGTMVIEADVEAVNDIIKVLNDNNIVLE